MRIAVEDFEVVETERRTGAAVALLVDLSYSMALRGTWGAAKSTAMALHSLVTTRFPQDAIQIIGFSSTAQVLRPETLAELSVDTLQGTNLQHGLMLARRFLAHHRDAEPVVLVVTDGEPTAHLEDDGTPFFCWPPMPETIARTVAEVERVARTGATRERLRPRPRARGWCTSCTTSPSAPAAGCSRPTPTASASTSSPTTSAPAGAAGPADGGPAEDNGAA